MSKILSLLFVFVLCLSSALTVSAAECDVYKDDKNKQVDCLQKMVDQTGQQVTTLADQVAKMDYQIRITAIKITQTEKQIITLEQDIVNLSGKIGKLDVSLNHQAGILIARIAESYKAGRQDPFVVFMSSKSFPDFIRRYRFLAAMQLSDRRLLLSMETTRTNYDEQKVLKEKAQVELEKMQKQLITQKKQLDIQTADQKRLLAETQGKEVEYQRMLAASRAELEAIIGITQGKGDETKVRDISQGEKIASVISGASPCSSGTHLHFEVRESGAVKNPFNYLRNISLTDNSDGDPHTGSGSWDWPLSEPIRFTQGFGANTSAIRSRTVYYSAHTGIDIISADLSVKSVKSGTLYRGGIACGKGTLRYVRVNHTEGGIDTYYLHVNY